MLNLQTLEILPFTEQLCNTFESTFGCFHPEYLHKIPALFYEFEELGINATMGCKSPGELRRGYAHFFWGVVHKYVEEGIKLLQITQEGKEWISLLHAHVFECEHFILSDTDS